MEIKRDAYLQQLIERKDNGMIKVITGIRRCGKSFLLFTIFKRYLLENGVDVDHIIEIALDGIENEELRDPKVCFKYIKDAMKDDGKYYLLLDEVQFMPRFEEVLNSLLRMSNIDVYVTGSNSKFLSSDIVTEFRGRGDEIRIYPLSFAEFYSVYDGDYDDAWDDYMDTFDEAVRQEPDAHPLVHSDRGFQYTSAQFYTRLKKHHMKQSMSRVAHCIDNGPMEGFWGILKREMYYKQRFNDRSSLITAIANYIDYYNNQRLQRKLHVMTPMKYHEQYTKAA